jgi:hypothetical protein
MDRRIDRTGGTRQPVSWRIPGPWIAVCAIGENGRQGQGPDVHGARLAVQSKSKNDYSDCLKMKLALFALINRTAVTR